MTRVHKLRKWVPANATVILPEDDALVITRDTVENMFLELMKAEADLRMKRTIFAAKEAILRARGYGTMIDDAKREAEANEARAYADARARERENGLFIDGWFTDQHRKARRAARARDQQGERE